MADPGLNRGYAYFVEENAYKMHLQTHGKSDQKETSSCNSHDAVKLANMRGVQGVATSGVGTVECSRHDMKRPCSVGDLQKGERYDPASKYMFEELRTQYRYVNMDYLFASSM